MQQLNSTLLPIMNPFEILIRGNQSLIHGSELLIDESRLISHTTI